MGLRRILRPQKPAPPEAATAADATLPALRATAPPQASYQELLAASVWYMEKGTANYLWQRTRRAIEVGAQGASVLQAEVTERLERELHQARERMRRSTVAEMGRPGSGAPGAGGGAAGAGGAGSGAGEKQGADWSVRGRTETDLTHVLENPEKLLEVRIQGRTSRSRNISLP